MNALLVARRKRVEEEETEEEEEKVAVGGERGSCGSRSGERGGDAVGGSGREKLGEGVVVGSWPPLVTLPLVVVVGRGGGGGG